MDFSRLEKSIMDVIKEEQAKLGYRKEKIRLFQHPGHISLYLKEMVQGTERTVAEA